MSRASSWGKLLLLSLLFALGAACSDDEGGPAQCAAAMSATPVRAPEGDALCAGRADCSVTAGAPDHQGCPNTCGCLCHDELCYMGPCTALVCTDPPVYR
jgi:hypothetical protein